MVVTKVVSVTLLVLALRMASAVEDSSMAAADSDLTPEQIAARIYAPFTRQAKRIGRAARQRANDWMAHQHEHQQHHQHHQQHHPHNINALRGARSTLAVHEAAPLTTTIAPPIQVVNTKIAAATTAAVVAQAIELKSTATIAASSAVLATTATPQMVVATTAAATTMKPEAAAVTSTVAVTTAAVELAKEVNEIDRVATTVEPEAAAVASTVAVTTAALELANADEIALDNSSDDEDDEDEDGDMLSGSAELVAPVTALHNVAQADTAGTSAKAGLEAPACQCEASNPAWQKTTRTIPECVFIDLGAANGNTFQYFLNNGYGDVSHCPSGKYQAVLVEANPRFNKDLADIASQYQGLVDSKSGTAAYMCEAQTSFFVDTVNTEHNYWGSSMSSNHPDAQKSGLQQVVVNTMNLNRYLYENTIPGDWVMVKMDIEGAEWEVIPCLAESSAASLIDRMYLEEHPQSWTQGKATQQEMTAAKLKLQSMGVDIPAYFSHTL
mmetsp:Transcript_25889/g.59763  ORF Transcript_25889/g.59763 Transcript_25889/m.59763 type:complete len:498 (-) Transcript_25889:53-1546(-)